MLREIFSDSHGTLSSGRIMCNDGDDVGSVVLLVKGVCRSRLRNHSYFSVLNSHRNGAREGTGSA